jgi:monoamine oxidase
MENADIIVIGAGAVGLMAAHTLAKAGKRVTILEARNRAGGRTHTILNTSSSKYAELGAEFVHGNLPVTMKLLKEAGIAYHPAAGEMWHYRAGSFSKGFGGTDDWGVLIQKLNDLKHDTSIGDFLQQQFGGEKYVQLRESVSKYVSGYDTADPFKASAFALCNEWQNEDEDAQYRIDGGYIKVIDYLVNESKANKAQLFLNTVVKHIYWESNKVEVRATDATTFQAEKVIIALPLGVLQAGSDEAGAITLHPAIPEHQKAIQQMGFGAIIKILLEFKEAFWESDETTKLAGHSLKEMGFLLSDEEIPTWWTQFPQHSTVLTGWLGGPPAEKKMDTSSDELLRKGLQSLANIFKCNTEELKDNLITWSVVNWTADPFTRGSYAYDTIAAGESREILARPVNDTIYFAGEYLYEGSAMGTVEAALTSGMEIANQILGREFNLISVPNNSPKG